MKTYGKEPESIESITAIFARDLAEFPVDKILKAIKTHSQRSQEFPTVADIFGLIKRNGKPEITQAMYINASKKDYENRSAKEHKLISAYEDDYYDSDWKSENYSPSPGFDKDNQLRIENYELKKEINRLGVLLRDARKNITSIEFFAPDEKINKTIAYMRTSGASAKDIRDFCASQGIRHE